VQRSHSIYGSPRQTFDVDIKFSLASKYKMEQFIEELKSIAILLPDEPIQFIKETNVIQIEIDDVRVNLVVADLPFEIEAIQRSRYVDFSNTKIKVCLPEDLIIQKAVSTREKDWLDIRNVIENQRDKMDWNYLLKHRKDLSNFLSNKIISQLQNHFSKIEIALLSEDFARIFIHNEEYPLKIEFVNDVLFHTGEIQSANFFHRIDSWGNILNNKICALSRDEAKDIADLIFLSMKYNFTWETMINCARQKDTWVNEIEVSQSVYKFDTRRLIKINWIK